MNAQTKEITVYERIDSEAGSFAAGLPGHVAPEKFLRTLKTAIALSPDIQRAVKTPRGINSLKIACAKAAADGLILDGREAALVTFRKNVAPKGAEAVWENELQYLPMVQGLLKKLRNSGQLASINAEVVHKNDRFRVILGDNPSIEHEPADIGTARGPGIAVYAIARLKDGSVQREVMDEAAILRIAAQSKNPDQYNQTKGKNWGEWWRKTVIRRICKYLPSSSDKEADDLAKVIEHADDEFDYNQDRPADTPTSATRKARGGAAAALKDVTPASRPEDESQDEGDVVDFDPATGEIVEDRQIHDDPI